MLDEKGTGDDMIRNIIFDIGNVLTDYRWREYLADQGFDEAMIERIALASTMSPVWDEYDRGVWTDEQIIQGFVDNDPLIEEELRRAFRDFRGLVVKREYAVPWIRELKSRGFRVYYLSNFSRKAHRECADALDFIPYMDGGILSYKDQVIKPDKAVYELLLSRYGLTAQESVFLDDMPRNVEAARNAGMHGIVFVSREQAQEQLELLEPGLFGRSMVRSGGSLGGGIS